MKSTPLTPGRKKLAALGIQIPFLPVTTSGSFPKTAELTEMRYKVAQGVLQPTELVRKERIATEIWLREQSRVGLNIFVDGEMERGNPIGYFAEKIEGFEKGGRIRLEGNRYYRKPVIKGKLAWKGPLIVESWQMTQRATHSPLKAVITGPYSLMDFSFNEFYSSREDILADLSAIIRKEITALTEAGAKIIQIDEPGLTSHPEDLPLIADLYKDLIKNQKPYFVLHHAYGDPAPLWPKIEKLNVDNFSFEAANSNMSILKSLKKNPTAKDVTLGLIDSNSDKVETPREIGDRAKAALKAVSPQHLWFSTDSGLKSLKTETAIEKLNVLVKTITKIRTGK